MKITPNTSYVTRGDTLVMVSFVTSNASAKYPVGGYIVDTGEAIKWTRNGKHHRNEVLEHSHDIVELLSEVTNGTE